MQIKGQPVDMKKVRWMVEQGWLTFIRARKLNCFSVGN